MKSVLPRFNSVRMAMDYVQRCYGPARNQGRLLAQHAGAEARALAVWKKKVAAAWTGVRIRLVQAPDRTLRAGESLSVAVAVFLNGLHPDDVVVEFLLGKETEFSDFSPAGSVQFIHAVRNEQGEATFAGEILSSEGRSLPTGLEHYKIRVFPCHPLLAHRFECGLMLWL